MEDRAELLERLKKPAKGSGYIQRKDREKAIVANREHKKAQVRRRDVTCRWPDCENCRRYKPRLEVAHLIPLSLGGPDETDNMMLLDFLTHQGEHSLHAQTRRIEPLTSRGADGPCRFWELDEQRGWTVVHTEDARS